MSISSGLYHPIILQHNSQPYHYEKREDATHIFEAYNQLCGDQFKLYLTVDAEGIIQEAYFHGYGCAISKASTSVLVSLIEGKSREQVKILLNTYYHSVLPPEKRPEEGLSNIPPKEFEAFAVAQKYPSRIKCATLSWDELSYFLSC